MNVEIIHMESKAFYFLYQAGNKFIFAVKLLIESLLEPASSGH